METLQSSLYAIATCFCAFFAILSRRLFTHISLSFFLAYLALKASSFFLEWVLHHPETPYKSVWMGILMCLSFLGAPCIWLFAKESVDNQAPPLALVSKQQRLFIFLCSLLTIPLISTIYDNSLSIGLGAMPQKSQSLIIHGTMLLCIGLFLLQVPYYLKKCLNILEQQTQKNMALFSNIDDMPLNILRVLIWVAAGHWLFSLSRTLMVWITDGSSILYLIFTAGEVSIIMWAMYEIFKSSIEVKTTGTPKNNYDNNAPLNPAEKAKFEGTDKNKYANYAQDDALRRRIASKIKNALEEDELYKNSNLKLQGLCQHINENSHYVSQVINQDLNNNFYELVNFYRIRAAQHALDEEPNESILDIALAVGYNSKSTFNSAFKRLTDMTPSQYRKRARD